LTGLQRQFLRHLGSEEEAVAAQGPALVSGSVPENLPGGSMDRQMRLAAELTITQAPAAVALPMYAGHPTAIPFKVRLHLAASIPLMTDATVGICAVNKNQLVSLSRWTPMQQDNTTAAPVLLKSESRATIALAQKSESSATPPIYSGAHEFSFPNLTFSQGSNVRKC